MQPSPTPSLRGPIARRALSQRILAGMPVLLAFLAFAGCRDAKVLSYDVPKEAAAELPASRPVSSAAAPVATASALPAPGTMASPAPGAPDSHGLQTAAGAGLAWTAPSTWQSKVGSAMRKATYAVTGEAGATADLAISAFPGDVGGEAANVNRWRGQLGLDGVSDRDALAVVQRLEANGLPVGVVDIASTAAGSPTRLLGAWVPYDGATWFFKLVGPDALVAKERAAFLEFLKTIRPAVAASAPAHP